MNSIARKFSVATRRYTSTVAMAMGLCVAGTSAAHAASSSALSAINAIGNTSSGGGFTVGGDVSGLVGTGLVLQLNGVGDLPVAADGSFEFAAPVADGSSYAVTVETQPASPAQTCTATNASGTIAGANVTDVSINCTTDADDTIFEDGFDGPGGGEICEPLQPIKDPSFEDSLDGSGPWASTSTNFGSALCSIAVCGAGDGSEAPHTGAVWAWFGGVPDGVAEDATASQSLVIPAGSDRYLNFWLRRDGGGGSSTLDVTVDGTSVITFEEPVEPELDYRQRSVDISSHADGASHTVEFHYSTTAPLTSTFNLDDVTIDCTGVPVVQSIPAAKQSPDSGMRRTQ